MVAEPEATAQNCRKYGEKYSKMLPHTQQWADAGHLFFLSIEQMMIEYTKIVAHIHELLSALCCCSTCNSATRFRHFNGNSLLVLVS